jgi:hypothetical protein
MTKIKRPNYERIKELERKLAVLDAGKNLSSTIRKQIDAISPTVKEMVESPPVKYPVPKEIKSSGSHACKFGKIAGPIMYGSPTALANNIVELASTPTPSDFIYLGLCNSISRYEFFGEPWGDAFYSRVRVPKNAFVPVTRDGKRMWTNAHTIEFNGENADVWKPPTILIFSHSVRSRYDPYLELNYATCNELSKKSILPKEIYFDDKFYEKIFGKPEKIKDDGVYSIEDYTSLRMMDTLWDEVSNEEHHQYLNYRGEKESGAITFTYDAY